MKRATAVQIFATALMLGFGNQAGAQFTSVFERTPDRPWPGQQYWANPLLPAAAPNRGLPSSCAVWIR